MPGNQLSLVRRLDDDERGEADTHFRRERPPKLLARPLVERHDLGVGSPPTLTNTRSPSISSGATKP